MKLLWHVVVGRRVLPALAVVGVMTVIGGLTGRIAFPIRLNSAGLPHRALGIELVCLVSVVLAGYAVRPRLWNWERLGAPRTRVVSALVAALVLAGVLPSVAVVLAQLPDDRSWAWLVANALVVAGATLVLSVLAGPLPGGVVALVLYFADAVVDNTVDGARPYLPLTAYPGPAAHWLLAALLDALAVVLYATTHGTTSRAHRLTHNQD